MLYEFRYTLKYWTEKNNYITYAILEITGGRLFIDCYNNGKITRIDITDIVNNICLMLTDISDRNIGCFEPIMYFLPHYDWSLDIVTDNLNIHCYGCDSFPPDWIKITKIFKYIGIR